MKLQEALQKLYTTVGPAPNAPVKVSSYLWVVAMANYETRMSGRTRSPYTQKMLDRMVYRHYID